MIVGVTVGVIVEDVEVVLGVVMELVVVVVDMVVDDETEVGVMTGFVMTGVAVLGVTIGPTLVSKQEQALLTLGVPNRVR